MLEADRGQDAVAILITDKAGFDTWRTTLTPRQRASVEAQGLKAEGYAHAIVPDDTGERWSVVAVVTNAAKLSSWCLSKLPRALPPGRYRLTAGASPGAAMFGWLTAQHRFNRYRKPKAGEAERPRILVTPDVARIEEVQREAAAVLMVRDLVDTPASDCGPEEIEAAARSLGLAYRAQVDVLRGEALEREAPMIAAVGRAAARERAPRLVELNWGKDTHPRVALVGKGVTFDTGGLDLKPAAAMGLMKKDMGGAAHALALARLVMEARLPVRLHLLLPLAENAVGGAAMRPGDVLTSAKGTTVEVDNTDAEGRLILADAITRACAGRPELLIDFATLTGAARVALGPDLPPLFANDDTLAEALLAAGSERDDPLWRMPLWEGYRDMLKAQVADITNSPSGAFAGAVTAALFLQHFVEEGVAWAHVDTFAWNPNDRPGRPKGGAALGLRAAWGMLSARYPR